MLQSKSFGLQGESTVAAWLEKHGATIMARNYQTKLGEVDIIATKGDIVAFVEVKTRTTEYFPIMQTVNWRKQQRIIKAARHFVLANQIRDKVLRFDVATVVADGNNQRIEYIKNAFTASY
jgi:putative endonuclease